VPIFYAIDKAGGLIRTRCYGAVTLAEVQHHFQTLKDDPNRSSHLDVLLDLSEVTSSPRADEIREAGRGPELLRGILNFGYCAIVTSRDVIFGMARMWAVFVEGYFTAVEVFRSATEAEIWLAQRRTDKRSIPAS
jgi:hypothetical protein